MDHIGILNFHFSNENYGALMVPYSLQKIISNSEIINYIPSSEDSINSVFSVFRKRFLKISKTRMETSKSLRNNAYYFDTIIVGSDQVFKNYSESPYFLMWAHGKKKCISYAASF